MINRKIVIGTAIYGVLAIVTIFGITNQGAKSQTSTAPTTNVNFTQLFKEKIKDQFLASDAYVIYQSPSTVVIDGEKLTPPPPAGSGGYSDNVYLWQGVDLVKQQGYTTDSITTTVLGTSGSPNVYHVILSHK